MEELWDRTSSILPYSGSNHNTLEEVRIMQKNKTFWVVGNAQLIQLIRFLKQLTIGYQQRRHMPVLRVFTCLLIACVGGALCADWQWEHQMPSLTSWILGADGEVYVYSYNSSNSQGSKQQIMCIEPNGTARWTLSGIFLDEERPRFYPLASSDLNGFVGPTLAQDAQSNRLHVLLGAYPMAYQSNTPNTPCLIRELAYAQIGKINTTNPKVELIRTIMPCSQSYVQAYGLYYSRNRNVHILYTGCYYSYLNQWIGKLNNDTCSGWFVVGNNCYFSTNWFGGVISNSTAPNRTRWDARFTGKSLKLMSGLGPNYDPVPLCLPPMGAADVDETENTIMMFFRPNSSDDLPSYPSPSTFPSNRQVIVFIDSVGEVQWARETNLLGDIAGGLFPFVLYVYRVWVRLGTNHAFTAQLIRYPNGQSRTAVVNCYRKSDGTLPLSYKWLVVEDMCGITIIGDKCYVGLVRGSCEGCSNTRCTEVWEVSPTGVRRIACHPGRGLAIAHVGNYIAALLEQPCNSGAGIKIQLWDTAGTPVWSATKCLQASYSFPTIGELQLRMRRGQIGVYLDVGARVVYLVPWRSVLVKGSWLLSHQ